MYWRYLGLIDLVEPCTQPEPGPVGTRVVLARIYDTDSVASIATSASDEDGLGNVR